MTRPRPADPRPRYRRRHGFSLVELLIVIAILAILAGILFVAFKGIAGSSRTNAARITLGNLNGLLAEFEVNAKSLDPINAQFHEATTAADNPPLFADFTGQQNLAQTAPGDVAPNQGAVGRYTSAAVVTTQDVMARLRSVPSARTMFDALPTDGKLPAPDDATQYVVFPAVNDAKLTARNTGGTVVLDPPVATDPWGGPIIYVPPGGLRGVTFEQHGPAELHTITSKGVLEPGPPDKVVELQNAVDDDMSDQPGTPPRPRSPFRTVKEERSLRPFFASAGPDGDFAKGDDNLYSFEQ